MEKHGYSYIAHAPDWAVSLPGVGCIPAVGEPCFSVPASRLFVGRIIWIAGMFEIAVKRVLRSAGRKFSPVVGYIYTRVSVRKAICCFKL